MVKKDCFGFVEHSELRSQGYCDVMKRLYCKTEECKFYKSKAQYDAEEQEIKRRKEQE